LILHVLHLFFNISIPSGYLSNDVLVVVCGVKGQDAQRWVAREGLFRQDFRFRMRVADWGTREISLLTVLFNMATKK